MNFASLQLEALHYPIQEVRANPLYDPQGAMNGSLSSLDIKQFKIEGRDDAISVEVTVSSDEENSVNHPYSYRLQGFCIITTGEAIKEDESPAFITTAITIMIGAIREHLASMTSRGPWGTHLINPIPLGTEVKKTETQGPP